ncbi:hypothetical protein PGH43_17430 [Legionella pneumophila 130b]|nr:hypothetical protein PGH43_17430 [Legionella pneumophila 130b]
MAKKQELISSPLRDRLLLQLEYSNRIVSEIDYANTIIDMLLVKASRDNILQNCILETCSIAECLSEAITRYPFQSPRERTLITWTGDFNLKALSC